MPGSLQLLPGSLLLLRVGAWAPPTTVTDLANQNKTETELVPAPSPPPLSVEALAGRESQHGMTTKAVAYTLLLPQWGAL